MIPEQNSLWDSERVIALIGSLASIISILLNIFQAIFHRSFKRHVQSVLLSASSSFEHVIQDAEDALATHAADRDPPLRSVKAHAEAGKTLVTNTLQKQFN